jgi:hypothetical protein
MTIPTATQWAPLAIDLFCGHCRAPINGRADKKYCNPRCAQRHKNGRLTMPFIRKCLVCGADIVIAKSGDANRKYCSQNCAKRAYAKGISVWNKLHPERVGHYRAQRVKKNADVWKEQSRSERKRILAALGGKCIVCEVANPSWLHVDYIPTSKGQPFRHPRTLRFTLSNLKLFRILCANHHYELTLTGKIEGTDIVQ